MKSDIWYIGIILKIFPCSSYFRTWTRHQRCSTVRRRTSVRFVLLSLEITYGDRSSDGCVSVRVEASPNEELFERVGRLESAQETVYE